MRRALYVGFLKLESAFPPMMGCIHAAFLMGIISVQIISIRRRTAVPRALLTKVCFQQRNNQGFCQLFLSVLGPPCLVRHTWRRPSFSLDTRKTSQGPLKGVVSAQKALQGTDTEMIELLGGKEKISKSPTRRSLIFPPGKSIIFYLSGPPNFWQPAPPLISILEVCDAYRKKRVSSTITIALGVHRTHFWAQWEYNRAKLGIVGESFGRCWATSCLYHPSFLETLSACK